VNDKLVLRALIAEDSVTTLELLAHMLESDSGIRVVGRARNGAEAVNLTKTLRPDVVVMDIHMPVLDGFEATRQIMIEAPTPIVIVSAMLDVRAVDVSLHALRLGALTVMAKPPGPSAPNFAEECARFVGTVRSMSEVKVVRRWASRSANAAAEIAPERAAVAQIIAIAASTGGPAALLSVLSNLPADLPSPILIVQHMAPGFVAGLASWLDGGCELAVKVAEPGERLVNGVAYLAPDDQQLGLLDRRTLQVSSAAPRGGFRPSGSFLFESVANVYGTSAIGVILTGMGDDGCAGLVVLRAAGGRIIAQDEATSVVFGMPAAAISARLPHATLPLELIASRLRAWFPKASGQERQKGTQS
jgi:two-component system, chemotaxis family, protein-glutamate methylesterase/glutaminase